MSLNICIEAPEIQLKEPLAEKDQKYSTVESKEALERPSLGIESENKFNRNFILVLNTVKAYSLFDQQTEIDGYIHNYIHKISPLAQTIFARLFLRKRVWFNQVLHLSKYSKRQSLIFEAVSELRQYGMISTDQQLLITEMLDSIQMGVSLDKETNELKMNMEALYQFLDSFTVVKLQKLLKVVSAKIKNLMLDNFVDVQETSPNINPFYNLQERLAAYGSESLNEKYLELSDKITEKFSGFMMEFCQKNQRQYKTFLNKREIIFKILKRIIALVKSCIILKD